MPSRRRVLQGGASLAALAALMPWLPPSAFASGTLLKRTIPGSGELLPVIGLGTSRTHDVAMSDEALQPLREVLQTLVNGGASLVDTAPSYGRAEAVCGALVAEDDMRKKTFLASKVSSSGRAAGERQITASFAALRTDTIDLMQVHKAWPDRQRQVILAGRLRPYRHADMPRYSASVVLQGDRISVPRRYREAFAQWRLRAYDEKRPRVQVEVAFGQRHEPWLVRVDQ